MYMVEHDMRFKALLVALHTPYPHSRSPALPVQVAYDHTKIEGESDLGWLERFLRMNGEEYRSEIGWDTMENRWTGTPDISACGELIIHDCLRWYTRGWDMSRHSRDDFEYPEDREINTIDPDAVARINGAVMPIPGEIARRSWSQQLGFNDVLCQFDIKRKNAREFTWRYALIASGEIELAHGVDEFWKIEGFIVPAIVPATASLCLLMPEMGDQEDK